MYRSVILQLLFLLVCSVPLQAQEAHELQGRVLNSSDSPIAKVQILDQATGLLLTETGKGGEFQLSLPDSVERVSLVFPRRRLSVEGDAPSPFISALSDHPL